MNKIIFCDLDGTLLDDNKNIPIENIKCINEAINNNCKFVISSGRSNMSLKYFNEYLGLDKSENYTIAYNGAYIYKTNTGEVLAEHLVEKNNALKAIKLCRNFNVDIMVYRDELLWFDKLTDRIDMYAKRNKVNTNIVSRVEMAADKDVSKVIIIGNNSELKKVENKITEYKINDEMTTFFSATDLYEFNPLGIDKGTGLEELCSLINVDTKNSIAIGDNYNDLSMIKKAGIGVCCSNGESGVKKYADYITEKNNNEGAVAEVIKKFILIKTLK